MKARAWRERAGRAALKGEREPAQPGARRVAKGGSQPLASAQWHGRVKPIWTLPEVGQEGAIFCPFCKPFSDESHC